MIVFARILVSFSIALTSLVLNIKDLRFVWCFPYDALPVVRESNPTKLEMDDVWTLLAMVHKLWSVEGLQLFMEEKCIIT